MKKLKLIACAILICIYSIKLQATNQPNTSYQLSSSATSINKEIKQNKLPLFYDQSTIDNSNWIYPGALTVTNNLKNLTNQEKARIYTEEVLAAYSAENKISELRERYKTIENHRIFWQKVTGLGSSYFIKAFTPQPCTLDASTFLEVLSTHYKNSLHNSQNINDDTLNKHVYYDKENTKAWKTVCKHLKLKLYTKEQLELEYNLAQLQKDNWKWKFKSSATITAALATIIYTGVYSWSQKK